MHLSDAYFKNKILLFVFVQEEVEATLKLHTIIYKFVLFSVLLTNKNDIFKIVFPFKIGRVLPNLKISTRTFGRGLFLSLYKGVTRTKDKYELNVAGNQE